LTPPNSFPGEVSFMMKFIAASIGPFPERRLTHAKTDLWQGFYPKNLLPFVSMSSKGAPSLRLPKSVRYIPLQGALKA